MQPGGSRSLASRQALSQLLLRTRVLSALRYPQYRKFWLGTLASVSSQQILMVGQGWLIYDLTGDPLYLGYAGLVMAIPAILLNLIGGVLADRWDQRRIIMVSQGATAALFLLLATLVSTEVVQVWHVLTVAFVAGAVSAFDQPSRQSLFPHLLDRQEMLNAVALNSSIWQGTRIVAPAVGGILIAQAGVATAFYVCAAGPLLMMALLAQIQMPPIPRARGKTPLHEVGEGLNFIRKNHIFAFLIGMTFFNSFFGMSYVALMPIFAKDVLGGGASQLGFLFSASGLGALLGTMVTASLGRVQRKGWLLVGGATCFGGFLILFAQSEWYSLSLAAVFLAGVFNSVYMIAVMTTLQLLVPDQLRGRVLGVYGMTWNIMPLGGMQAGAIASVQGAPFAVSIGGLAVITFAMGVALSNRQIRELAATPAFLAAERT